MSDLGRAFALGTRFDLQLALFVVLPLAALALVPLLHPRRRLGEGLWRSWLSLAGVFLTLVYLSDLGHYAYLHERLDAAVLDELRSPREAFGMVWQSYPVAWGLLLVAGLTWGWHFLARRAVAIASTPASCSRRRRMTWGVGTTLLSALGVYGSLSWYPLRWSQAFFGTDPFVSALASNPVLYFGETLSNHSRPPDRERIARDYDLVADLLEVEPRAPDTLSFTRVVRPDRRPAFAPNLVVIHLESWAAFQTGVMGNTLEPSPRFDALANDSVLFTHAFVPSGPTARSVFSMLTGIPDVAANNPRGSASRDPRSVRQPVLVNALTGYEKHYFLGGNANWANIRAILAGNVADLHLHEEGSYDRERVDVWGVSDLDLFESAVESLDACNGPFFAFIQTSGNHEPYTIPPGHGDFEERTLDEETLRQGGFRSLAAYNGFRFLDYSVGRFFELAAQRPWYPHTVFVLYGDHGVPSVNGVPFERMGIVRHHVPLVFHAPDLLAPTRINTPASSVDVLPTALSLMGVPYTTGALGRDLFADRPAERRFAFLSCGLVQGEWFLRIEPDGRRMLYRYAAPDPEQDLCSREPERTEHMETVWKALLGWASWTQHDAQRRLRIERLP